MPATLASAPLTAVGPLHPAFARSLPPASRSASRPTPCRRSLAAPLRPPSPRSASLRWPLAAARIAAPAPATAAIALRPRPRLAQPLTVAVVSRLRLCCSRAAPLPSPPAPYSSPSPARLHSGLLAGRLRRCHWRWHSPLASPRYAPPRLSTHSAGHCRCSAAVAAALAATPLPSRMSQPTPCSPQRAPNCHGPCWLRPGPPPTPACAPCRARRDLHPPRAHNPGHATPVTPASAPLTAVGPLHPAFARSLPPASRSTSRPTPCRCSLAAPLRPPSPRYASLRWPLAAARIAVPAPARAAVAPATRRRRCVPPLPVLPARSATPLATCATLVALPCPAPLRPPRWPPASLPLAPAFASGFTPLRPIGRSNAPVNRRPHARTR
nr:vegetative cell wall protein gp1-like [Aegilops tauschii subsp. strangulata]